MSHELAKCMTELEDLHDEVRARGIATLARLEDPVAFLVLERTATADASIQNRFAAKKVLHQIKEAIQQRMPPLSVSTDPELLSGLLSSDDAAVRRKCLDLCLAGRILTVMPLVPPLLETEQDPAVKRSALLVAVLAGRHAIRVLAPFLSDPDPQVRAIAILGLGIIDDVDVFPHAVQAFTDSSSDVQRHAYRISARLGKANFNRLLERMASSGTPWKRLAAVKACGKIKQPHLRQLIERLWEDPDPAVRQAAAAALAAMSEPSGPIQAQPAPAAPPSGRKAPPPLPPRVAPPPQPAASPQSGPMPRSAPDKAPPPPQDLHASSVSTPVMPGESGEHGRAADLAAWVCENDTAKVPEIQEWFQAETEPRMRASLVAAAGKLGGRLSVEMLKKCLSDPDGRIRANAVEGLRGKVGPQTLVGLLHDSDNRCRANAIVALKDHKRVDIIRHLKDMAAGDVAFRKSAIYAIVEVCTPEAQAILAQLQDDPDPDVKEKACQAQQMVEARLAEAAAQAEAAGTSTQAASGAAGPGTFDQLKSRITEAFSAFRKKLGQ